MQRIIFLLALSTRIRLAAAALLVVVVAHVVVCLRAKCTLAWLREAMHTVNMSTGQLGEEVGSLAFFAVYIARVKHAINALVCTLRTVAIQTNGFVTSITHLVSASSVLHNNLDILGLRTHTTGRPHAVPD
jgi:hypothetical protein